MMASFFAGLRRLGRCDFSESAPAVLPASPVEHCPAAGSLEPRRFAEPKLTRGSASATVVAPVVRLGACQFCLDDPDAVSAGFVTA
jgi:hypothetical protein